ncbi:MAG TPA: 50S ribosomal protein L20 [Firmicutes bacterium]|nr:50S ribosomal protein L20 [Bacillota bacterium]
MPRAKGNVPARARHKKVLKLAKGYRGSKSKLYRSAVTQLLKSQTYATRDRKQRKRNFRRLWIARINAAARVNGISYSRLMCGLKQAGVTVNRKMLADLALNDAAAFSQLVETAKQQLA